MTTLTFYPMHTHNDATTSFFAHDPYVESFWLSILGPTATMLMNHLSLKALITPNQFLESAHELSLSLGTGARDGTSSPVRKQLARLVQIGFLTSIDANEYLVPRTITPLPDHFIYRLSQTQRLKHTEWIQRLQISPLSTQRRRALSLLSHLQILGLRKEVIHSTFSISGLHPSIIGETLTRIESEDTAA